MRIPSIHKRSSGFTMAETVITIGVVAVLITAFLAVFGPAAQGIRKAISAEEADRLQQAVENGLVTVRDDEQTEYSTGFEKAFEWINDSIGGEPFLVYKYRGDINVRRPDGTIQPFIGDGVAGKDFVIQPMLRQKSDPVLEDDLDALDGRVFVVKLAQLVYDGSSMVVNEDTNGDARPISNEFEGSPVDFENFTEAVLPFHAEFYTVPNSSYNYIQNNLDLENLNKPLFSRNMAVRR